MQLNVSVELKEHHIAADSFCRIHERSGRLAIALELHRFGLEADAVVAIERNRRLGREHLLEVILQGCNWDTTECVPPNVTCLGRDYCYVDFFDVVGQALGQRSYDVVHVHFCDREDRLVSVYGEGPALGCAAELLAGCHLCVINLRHYWGIEYLGLEWGRATNCTFLNDTQFKKESID